MKKITFPIWLILCAAALAISCQDPIGSIPGGKASGAKSTVTIRLAGGGERTLLPTPPASADKYSLSFTPEGGQEPAHGINDITPAQLADGVDVTLSAGKWTVTVTAYVEITGVTGLTHDGFYPVARGDTEFTVTEEGAHQEVEVTLNYITAGGEGLLDYDITLPPHATAAVLTVLTLEGSQLEAPVSINLKASADANAGKQALPSGYYILQIRVTGATPDDVTVKSDVLWIYGGMTTFAAMSSDFTIIKKTIISDPAAFALDTVVTLPAAFGDPQTYVETAWYTGSVSWLEEGLNTPEYFIAGKRYTATLYLSPKEEFTFGNLAADAFSYSYTGATAANNAGSTTVTVSFPPVEAVEFPLIYKVNPAGTAFAGAFKKGGSVAATNIGTANTASFVNLTKLDGTANGWKAVDTGNANTGYIALGNTVGRALKTMNTWTLETYVYVPTSVSLPTSGDAPMIWSFGYTDDYKTTNGSAGGEGPTFWIRLRDLSVIHRNPGWSTNMTSMDVTSNVSSSPDIRGKWRHLAVTVGESDVKVYVDGEAVKTGMKNTFDPTTLDTFNYAYLGRAIFHANGDTSLRNSRFAQFALRAGALTAQEVKDLSNAMTDALYGRIESVTWDVTPNLIEGKTNVAAGATVGTLIIQGGKAPYGVSFISGTGSTDNALFVIDGLNIKVGGAALTAGAKTVRVCVTDADGETFEKVCALAVGVPPPAPTFHYDFSTYSGTSVTPQAGTGPGTLNTGASISSIDGKNVLKLAGTGSPYFTLGNAANVGAQVRVEDFTVSTYMFIRADASLSGNGWIPWAFAETTSSITNDTAATNRARMYLQVRTNEMEVDIQGRTSGYNRQWNYVSGQPDPRGKWIHIVYTHARNGTSGTNSTGIIYVDGIEIGRKTDAYRTTSAWGTTNPASNTLGRPTNLTSGYNYMQNTYYADFRIYNNKALDAAEVAGLLADLNETYDDSFKEATLRAEIEAYKDTLVSSSATWQSPVMDMPLPTGNGVNITISSWVSDTPAVMTIDAGKAVIESRPAFGSGDATVTLTATFTSSYKGADGTTKTVSASYGIPYTVKELPDPAALPASNTLLLDLSFKGDPIAIVAAKGAASWTSGAAYVDGRRKRKGQAASFTDDPANYIKVFADNGTSPLLTGATNFTVSFWVKPNTTATAWWFYAAPVEGVTNVYNSNENYLGVFTGTVVEVDRYKTTRNTSGSFTLTSPANTITANNWVFVTIVNSEFASEIYINGVSQGSRTTTISLPNFVIGTSPILYIGRANWGNGEGANGLIESYKIYNSALTATQVAALYWAE